VPFVFTVFSAEWDTVAICDAQRTGILRQMPDRAQRRRALDCKWAQIVVVDLIEVIIDLQALTGGQCTDVSERLDQAEAARLRVGNVGSDCHPANQVV